MSLVAISSVDASNARQYIQVMESLGAAVRLLTPEADGPAEDLLQGAGGLLLSGGPDVDPARYGAAPDPSAGLHLCRPLDALELKLLDYALGRDMPVLAICRGMQLLNVAFGGKLIQDLPDHREEDHEGELVSRKHSIFLSPGSKAAAIIGSAGFFRVNSRHHQGLREAQRAPRLMSTAYSVEDGLVEGLESVEHSWVIGLQCHPERQDEVPRSFANLFAALAERAEGFGGSQGLSSINIK
ncbi:MAG: gamma-glutamyl-gamma-aminobutyrate hydrolase family protein [Dehalococcoidia bacterium]|nr:gamma-glutamyl-gamma-aminobutyrate hydrolase family protein [Dehalococcoidia bacterium]MSQ16390.1 gamma-glutamyl-gamma-aminobutyrate hydrolase family protein [Dehalococcoidia bacterium]